MSYLTQEEFQSAFAGWTLLQDCLEQFAKDYIDSFGNKSARETVTEVKIQGETIEINTETYSCSCCGADYDYYTAPIEYLWNDWRVTEKAARDERNRLKQEEEKRQKEAAQKAREEQRYKQYLAMKKEFEAQ